MGNITFWILLILSAVLFLATKKNWIAQETLQTLANAAGVVALLAAILVFVIPAAQPQINSVEMTNPTTEFKLPPVQDTQIQPTISPTSTQPQPEIVNSPSSTEENWAIKFLHTIGSNFWNVGNYEYTLSINCPDYTGEWVNTFEVSENAPTEPFWIYLRLLGVRDSELGGTSIEKVHPTQQTVAIITLTQITKLAAENYYVACDARAKIAEKTFDLIAQPPFILE